MHKKINKSKLKHISSLTEENIFSYVRNYFGISYLPKVLEESIITLFHFALFYVYVYLINFLKLNFIQK